MNEWITCKTDSELFELNGENIECDFTLENVRAIEAVETIGSDSAFLSDDDCSCWEVFCVVQEIRVHPVQFTDGRIHFLVLLILAHCVEVKEFILHEI